MAVALNDVRFWGKSRHCGHVAFHGSIRAPPIRTPALKLLSSERRETAAFSF
jgi:hypothetical protein